MLAVNMKTAVIEKKIIESTDTIFDQIVVPSVRYE